MTDLGALRSQLKERGSLTIEAKVIAKASRTELSAVLEDGTLRLKVRAAPEQGKANEQVRRLLASLFDVPERAVEISRGAHSPRKRITIYARASHY
ncbi:MAG: DUF167 domain-containing protein [Bryobacteraceae bacterium]